jgi:spore coat protein U-like protein
MLARCKRVSIAMALCALGTITVIPASAATATATISAQALVQGACVFNKNTPVGSNTNIDFGTINTSTVAAPVPAVTKGKVFYNCSNNMPYVLTVTSAQDNAGQPRLKNGTNFLNYTRTPTDSGNGTGKGMNGAQESNVTIDGSIAQADAQAAVSTGAGLTYTDTVTVTLTY